MAKVSFVFEENYDAHKKLHTVEVFTIAGSNRIPAGQLYFTPEELDAFRHMVFYGCVGSQEADVAFMLFHPEGTGSNEIQASS